MQLEALVGQFVVEIGVRQVWPFLGFCDNRPTPSTEVRFYFDAPFSTSEPDWWLTEGDPDAGLPHLLELNGMTVTAVERAEDRSLTIVFDDGDARLTVSGEPTAHTTGDVWWFGSAG
ncbi:hypothetical protein OJ997_07380 [Solirubrobacter phytolaccae]|uniref:Uncharacterized protein n=1 Tax=Solirubrobacter phytolaccae TaxID=1404360 RepID=A0A9X3N5J4_9ACTN|nr:hypothetical protein [Solirubrobacter phytolaccae]MDA0180113.1 hypothetical protein [Solirubrobacter phytolaccae]